MINFKKLNINQQDYIAKISGHSIFLYNLSEPFCIELSRDIDAVKKKIGLNNYRAIFNLLKEARNGFLDKIEVAVTSSCNLRCKHCYQGDMVKNKVNFIDLKYLKKLFIDCKKLGVYEIILTGGEVFTYPRIEELLNFIKKEKFRIVIVTNGTIIDEDMLSKNKPFKVIVSVDGFKKEHEDRRGIGTFDKTVTTIKKLIKSKIFVEVNCSLDNKNIIYLKKFIRFLKNLGVKSIRILTIGASGNALKNKQLFVTEQQECALLKEVYHKYRKGKEFPPCGVLKKIISVDYDGTVYPCNMFRNYKLLPLGNIKQKRITEIYKNIHKNRKLRELFELDVNRMECIGCKFFHKCLGGCRARAFKSSESVYGKDPFACFVYINKKQSMIPNYLLWG